MVSPIQFRNFGNLTTSGLARNTRRTQTAQIHRLATKSRATVTRPSAARSLSPVANGKMSVDEAFEAAWKTARR